MTRSYGERSHSYAAPYGITCLNTLETKIHMKGLPEHLFVHVVKFNNIMNPVHNSIPFVFCSVKRIETCNFAYVLCAI